MVLKEKASHQDLLNQFSLWSRISQQSKIAETILSHQKKINHSKTATKNLYTVRKSIYLIIATNAKKLKRKNEFS